MRTHIRRPRPELREQFMEKHPMAQVDYFLKLTSQTEGMIEGESKDAQFPKQIELLSWGWSSQNATNIGSAVGGAGAGKASLKDFKYTAVTNKSSVNVMMANWCGSHYKSAVLTCRKAGDTPQVFLRITMETVFVTSYEQTGGSDESEVVPTDEVTFAYGKIHAEYGVQDQNGKVKSLDQKAGWDQIQNKRA
jgi:type VI secretion system secreted protein Hcp